MRFPSHLQRTRDRGTRSALVLLLTVLLTIPTASRSDAAEREKVLLSDKMRTNQERASQPQAEALMFIGLGSNLLVRDGGFAGTVVFTHGALSDLRLEGDGGDGVVIHAEAGVAAPKLARFAATHDLVGAEFLAGVPGTIGGALAMNAGCGDRVTPLEPNANVNRLPARQPARQHFRSP